MYELLAIPDISKFGSILMMLIFISVLIIAHEMGHFFVARKCGVKVERFGFGLPFGPTLWSRKIGDVEYCIHACLFGGYVAFADDDPENPLPKDSPQRFENQPLLSRFAVMVAGVTVNAILGWALMFFVFMTWGYPTGEAERRVMIGGVTNASAPAAQAGFANGDELKAINGQAIAGTDYMAMVKNVQSLFKSSAARLVEVEVLRGTETLSLKVTPDQAGTIGIQLAAVQRYEAVKNPVDGSVKTTSFLGNVIVKQFEAFGRLFTGKMALKELAGPIGIVKQGAAMIDQNGIQTGLMLTAIISVILAVMNLLPIPALDGGHIFFLLIEALKGSPVKQEVRERFTQYGFMGLLALIVFILGNDIYNVFISPGS
jgi:membrane-associated protease RseP (regulator of RpoE activity)